jgi:septal ring-binding cell division protein DamX
MHKPTKHQEPFFLTRNSANIMEDLVRRISVGSSVSLISGVKGVGKSRFLSQFYTLYQNRFELVLVRFNAENNLSVSGSELVFTEQSFVTAILQKLKQGSALIIDQLDLASPQTQRKIFQYCTENANVKGINLIFSAQTSSLQQLLDLSRSCHVSIERAELSALDQSEQLEYIRACCCTEPGYYPVIPAAMKTRLAVTGGIFVNLDVFIQQHRDQIHCTEAGLQSGLKSPQVYLLLAAMLIVAITGGYLVSENIPRSSESAGLNATATESSIRADSVPNNGAAVESPVRVVASKPVNLPEEILNADSDSSRDDFSGGVEAVARAPGVTHVSVPVIQVEPAKTLLQRRMQATLDWLASSDDSTASIQIMSLVFKNNSEQLLNRYLQKLEAANIDLNEIKIYQFSKKGKSMYAVLYGSYPSYAVAADSIESIPVALKANGPISRTIKGINDEINF